METTTIQTEFDDDDVLVFEPLASAIFFAIFAFISASSVTGNFLVMTAFKNDKSLRRPANMLLVSLAVTDFFTGLIAIPAYTVTRTIVSDFTCYGKTRYLLFFPGMVCGVSSVTHLSIIAVDRYIAVSRPLRYPRIVTKQRCIAVLIVGAVFSIAACSWPSFSMGQSDDWFCGEQKKTEVVSAFVLGLCFIIVLYFGVMIFCHIHMIRTAIKHVRLRRTLSKSSKTERTEQEDAKSRLRATVTVGIIMGAFAICWTPIIFKFLFQSFAHYSSKTFLIVQVACEIPFYANSMVNPIIYGYRNEHFRHGYKRALHSCCPCLFSKPIEPRRFSRVSSGMV
ncbi:Adenosine receptor A2b [Holothuria leucospilota]|uniref:Adenosine receptor A2b n=1 Tax=Holothuria leucospilota TaxID=206669 RepID=A0A9Q1CH25_HOLLE|nr:Adenosine receptor A2b [Holothuria leucospilota]